jgi:hypothetical protein
MSGIELLAMLRRSLGCLVGTSRPHLTALSVALNPMLKLHRLLA